MTTTLSTAASPTIALSATPFALAGWENELVEAVVELARTFAMTAAHYDDRAEIAVGNLVSLHDAGLSEAMLPQEVGGRGLSYQAFGEIVRVICEADPATGTIFTMHSGAAVSLALLTKDTLGSFYADEVLAGKRFSNALSEPTSGNRFLNPQQAAVPVEGGWALEGAKRFVSGSEIADYLLVNALVDGEPVFFGVPTADDSISIIPIWDTLGLRATRSQLLSFDNTVLRVEQRGRTPRLTDFAVIPAGLPMISLGVADAALAALITHARGRIILGKALSHQQWLQFEVAEVQSRLEAVRAFVRQTLWQADHHEPSFFSNLSRAKYLANKVAVEVAQLAVRAGGASGFLKTSPIQRHLRDAEAGQLMAYSTEVLAGEIGRDVFGIAPGEVD
ncbi:acyl-CoA dehydrogenase family protein [Subtercola boreus]|uniref:Acyl-CoA dehydrogenase n=1 Tax=Subtercola boreus TaxID=120213 RepID=A0A3E0W756_9MICO|nr:acyl-CoA dehydrogenase family protein [Subtercola boreus]RFA18069.1 acyl-CoA dehydrogenase [Subtercola boreus]RFA18451.1 acyl-CoA dehydrogenase [Subtercola boreus]RFA24980.1 acyl-CoA dehydrogenase [Subtercola boreus]